MNETMLSGFIVGILAMVFWTPFLMTKGILSLEGTITFSDYLTCLIPIFNIGTAEKRYSGRVGFCTISTIVMILCTIIRVVLWWFFYENILIGTISIVIFYFGIVLYLISNMYFVYRVIRNADTMEGIKLFLFALIYPLGQYYIGTMLNNEIRYNMKQEDTFK